MGQSILRIIITLKTYFLNDKAMMDNTCSCCIHIFMHETHSCFSRQVKITLSVFKSYTCQSEWMNNVMHEYMSKILKSFSKTLAKLRIKQNLYIRNRPIYYRKAMPNKVFFFQKPAFYPIIMNELINPWLGLEASKLPTRLVEVGTMSQLWDYLWLNTWASCLNFGSSLTIRIYFKNLSVLIYLCSICKWCICNMLCVITFLRVFLTLFSVCFSVTSQTLDLSSSHLFYQNIRPSQNNTSVDIKKNTLHLVESCVQVCDLKIVFNCTW